MYSKQQITDFKFELLNVPLTEEEIQTANRYISMDEKEKFYSWQNLCSNFDLKSEHRIRKYIQLEGYYPS